MASGSGVPPGFVQGAFQGEEQKRVISFYREGSSEAVYGKRNGIFFLPQASAGNLKSVSDG